MSDLNLSKEKLLEQAKMLAAQVLEAEQQNSKLLDASELKQAELRQYMREQESLIQEMKYQFNLQVMRLRQDFCKRSAPPAACVTPPHPLDSAPSDSPSTPVESHPVDDPV